MKQVRRASPGRRRWQCGSVFAVPLPDGTFGLVQALDPVLANVVDCALLAARLEIYNAVVSELRPGDVIAVLGTWKRALQSAHWRAITEIEPLFDPLATPNRQRLARRSGGEGVAWVDAQFVADLLAAWHGLVPWNVLADPLAYDKCLLVGIHRPLTARVLPFEERRTYRAAHGLSTVREPHEA
jgi:hypothetical protein